MNYFEGIKTLEELKKLYKELCIKHHPDMGGDLITMQLINEQFQKKIKELVEKENENKTEKKDWTSDDYAEVIQKVLKMGKMTVEIIGQWIWCFNSYDQKEELKKLGFWFSKSKKAWVYSGSPKKIKYRSRNSVQDLRNKWGSEVLKED